MKARLFFDTSVIVASLVRDHPHHAPAAALLNGTFSRKETAVLSAHGLAEVYAVLTRAPSPLLITPGDCWRMIEELLLAKVELVSLTASEYRNVVAEGSRNGLVGGRIYDLIHIRSARKAGCTRLYTFNVKHFREIAPDDMQELISSP